MLPLSGSYPSLQVTETRCPSYASFNEIFVAVFALTESGTS